MKGRAHRATSASRIRVGIADDHAIVRRALHEFLRAFDALEVVGEAASGREAVELARTVPLDVLLLDIEMPGQTGIDAIPHILARDNAPAILVLSAHDAASFAPSMMTKGAAGYLSKACDPLEIVQAITSVAQGRKYFGEARTALPAGANEGQPTDLPHRTLTNREFQLLLRFAQGQTGPQVARELSLSHKTVLCYRVSLMSKMRARTNSDLTYYAFKHKLIA